MAGVNLHDGFAEVAFEQWIERAAGFSRLQRSPGVRGERYRKKVYVVPDFPYRQSAESSLSEVRW